MNAKDLIVTRMQRLQLLGLEGQPAADVIKMTARVWIERLGHINPDRLALAFDAVEANATRWPTPGSIKAALPSYEHTYTKPLPTTHQIAPDPEERARARERVSQVIAACASRLRVDLSPRATASVPAFDALLGEESGK